MIEELYEITNTGERLKEGWHLELLVQGSFKKISERRVITGLEWKYKDETMKLNFDSEISSVKVSKDRLKLICVTMGGLYIYSQNSQLLHCVGSPIKFKGDIYMLDSYESPHISGDNILSFKFTHRDFDYYAEIELRDYKILKIEGCK